MGRVLPFPGGRMPPSLRASINLVAVDVWPLPNGLKRVSLRTSHGWNTIGDFEPDRAFEVAMDHGEHRILPIHTWAEKPEGAA